MYLSSPWVRISFIDVSESTTGKQALSKQTNTLKSQSYACDVCGWVYKSKAALNHHKVSHSDRYRCSVCKEYRGRDSCNVEQHMRIHTKEKPFKCPSCDSKFSSKSSMKEHVVTLHEAHEFQCPDCTAVFGSSSHLAAHNKRVHHKKLTELMLQCDQCSYKTMDASSLRVHKVTHSDLRPFECDKCPYAAKLKKQLNKHLRIHEEGRERKHVCDVCGFRALRKEQLKNHY